MDTLTASTTPIDTIEVWFWSEVKGNQKKQPKQSFDNCRGDIKSLSLIKQKVLDRKTRRKFIQRIASYVGFLKSSEFLGSPDQSRDSIGM
jgi:hypothetical protein